MQWTQFEVPEGIRVTVGREEDGITRLSLRLIDAPADVWEDGERNDSDMLLRDTKQQLMAYFAGQLREFEVPLAPQGTPFQKQVWDELLAIPYGTTLSYTQLAYRVGRPTAMRAVGSANGANPIALIIPCHRVIAADGSLAGYAGGIEIKRRLLALEGTHPSEENLSLFPTQSES